MRDKKAVILLVCLPLILLLPISHSVYVPGPLARSGDASDGSSLGPSSKLEQGKAVLEKPVGVVGSDGGGTDGETTVGSGGGASSSEGGAETTVDNGSSISSEDAEREKRQIEEEPVGDPLGESYNNLPPVLKEMVVEMDIMNTLEVQEVRSSGTLGGLGEEGENGATREKRGATSNSFALWTDNIVPYAFQAFDNSTKELIEQAMKEWTRHTCITFKEWERTDVNFLYFVAHPGCYSYIGMIGGRQRISIGLPNETYCRRMSVVAHEIGHAIGFWHEQSRPDRDDYVRILTDNIKPHGVSQFAKYSREKVDSLGIPYDYNSIMHYSPIAFAIDTTKPTIVPVDPAVHRIGQSVRLSPLDILQANLLYKCPYIHNRTAPANLTASQNNTFLIRNSGTSSCLANTHTRVLSTFKTKYTHDSLYSASLVTCNASSPTQRWQWTNNDSLLHVATYLCLGRHWDDGSHKLVLSTCKWGNDTGQQWSCGGRYIEQEYSSISLCIAGTRKVSMGKRDVVDVEGILDQVARLEDEGEALSQPRTAPSPQQASAQQSSGRASASTRQTADVVDTYHEPDVRTCDRTDSHQEWTMESFIGDISSSITETGSDEDGTTICSTKSTESHRIPKCYSLDMKPLSSVAHGKHRWATCARAGYYINGFYHTYHLQQGNHNHSGLLSGVKCCAGDSVFTGEPNTPTTDAPETCYEFDWWYYTKYVMHEGWFTCPRGMLLKGILLTAEQYIPENSIITKASCCMPDQGSLEYVSCYTAESTSVSDTGVHLCTVEGFQMAGLLRKNCNASGRECGEEITCCMQA